MINMPLPDKWANMIIRAAPVPENAHPLTLADMATAMERIQEAMKVRDRYVFPSSRWGRILDAASPEFRAELEAMQRSGTIVVSSLLPDEDHAYHIKGQPWTR